MESSIEYRSTRLLSSWSAASIHHGRHRQFSQDREMRHRWKIEAFERKQGQERGGLSIDACNEDYADDGVKLVGRGPSTSLSFVLRRELRRHSLAMAP